MSSCFISSNCTVVVATASVSNLYLMRRNELKEGIEVKDSSDCVVGTSFVAAKRVSIFSNRLPTEFIVVVIATIHCIDGYDNCGRVCYLKMP